MNEFKTDPGRHFVDHDVVSEVGTNLPVRLIQAHIFHPTAPGYLEERVNQKEQESPAWRQYPSHLMDRRLERVHMLEGHTENHAVEHRVGAGELLRSSSHEGRSTAAMMGDVNLRGGGVDSQRPGPDPGDPPSDLPFAASHVEDTPCPLEMVLDQRENLLLVFGVGSLGKARLPPTCVLFPQGVANHLDEANQLHLGPVLPSRLGRDTRRAPGPEQAQFHGKAVARRVIWAVASGQTDPDPPGTAGCSLQACTVSTNREPPLAARGDSTRTDAPMPDASSDTMARPSPDPTLRFGPRSAW